MRKNLIFFKTVLLSCLFLGCHMAFGQAIWQSLGPDDLNQPYANGVSGSAVAIHPATGEAYMAYSAYLEPSGEGFVRKFNSVTGLWENVGGTFSAYSTSDLNLVFDSAGTLFMAYRDSQNSGKATVKKFNEVSGGWDMVGPPGLSAGNAQNISLVADAGNVLYIGYSDTTLSNRATVKKFDGTSWINVGVTGFSVTGTVYNSLAISPDGSLYMGYASYIGGAMKASVMKFNGTIWEILGDAGFSTGGTSYTKMAVNPTNNIPYIAYSDFGSGYKAVVKKFNGTTWENVGASGFSPTSVDRICFDISSDGTPFIGYQSGSVGGKATVMKYSGAAWTVVGQQSFSVGTVFYTDIALNGNTPFMSFSDYFNGNKATLMKFDGAEWICLGGTIGFSEETTRLPDSSGLRESDLVVTTDGSPYFGYREASNNGYATVRKYNYTNSKWEIVGSPGFSGVSAKSISMAAHGNTVYISYRNDNTYKATVKKFNGTAWENVGAPNFTADSAMYGTLAVAQNGLPYLVFADGSNAEKATVMKFNGTAWEIVGSAGFSTSQVYDPTITIGPDGLPYVAYTRATSPGAAGFVMKFNGLDWEPVGGTFSNSQSNHHSLKFGPDGYLYIAYMDYGLYKGCVKKFNGSIWEIVGGPGFSQDLAQEINLDINSAGHLYVSFKDYEKQDKATVVRYNGISWVPVGTAGLSAGPAHWPGLVITPDDHAILTYTSPCAYSKTIDVHCYTNAPVALNQTVCTGATVNDLLADGENLRWYSVNQFGTPLAQETPLENGNTYYVSQMMNDCEGSRTAITVTINEVSPPQGMSPQVITSAGGENLTLQNLNVEGVNVKWYDANGILLPLTTQITNGAIYYATQTINGCESPKLPVTVEIILGVSNVAKNAFLYYPNPVFDKLHILSETDIIDNLEVFTIYGQKVINMNVSGDEAVVDMVNLSNGIYLVRAQYAKNTRDFFVVKK